MNTSINKKPFFVSEVVTNDKANTGHLVAFDVWKGVTCKIKVGT
jgi:hypothetical protein